MTYEFTLISLFWYNSILLECLSTVVIALWYLCLRSANCTVKHIQVTSKNNKIAETVAKNESMSDIK